LHLRLEYYETDISTGAGCVAALEAEKWLSEQEEGVAEDMVKANGVEKSKNPAVAEYKQNPLL
jgi:thioredoxin reductase (NADPH)